ncbi:hypothetical protein RvY_09946-2 [Ramazzottius varieornatus]|uniref:DUF4139 domain-containing protein n=1 Tax=Ramazzottius varieornatus TaxID=947166 RepID=A0A1D1VD84_RAMVA|nr:hypothetical protein RvY_09946-2 [Ramazzottius varieornatus]
MLNVLRSDKVRIGICYTVKEASWCPSYDIRLDGDAKQVKISYFCWTRQWTGEDWSNAEVMVAADRSSQDGVTDPDETNALLSLPSSRPASASLKDCTDSVTKGSPMEKPFEKSLSGPTQEKRVFLPKRSVVPFSTLVDRDGILGHGRPARFLVLNTTTGVRMHHTCHPSNSLEVGVTCTTSNQTQTPFLPGPAAVYSSGNYVNTIQLEHVNPNEDFDLLLPSDPLVEVHPKYPVRTTKPVGPTEGNFIVESEFTMEYDVKNNRKLPILITLTETYPRSSNERLKVLIIFIVYCSPASVKSCEFCYS